MTKMTESVDKCFSTLLRVKTTESILIHLSLYLATTRDFCHAPRQPLEVWRNLFFDIHCVWNTDRISSPL